jgi:hypothetical protein
MKIFGRRGIETLRQPDRLPRCYEMTDIERQRRIKEWNARNIWNDTKLAEQDHPDYQEYWGA